MRGLLAAFMVNFATLASPLANADEVTSYEIARGKAALSAYNTYIFRDEFIHERRGTDGSTLRTFCATVQSRSPESGRVVEQQFYWVLRVYLTQGFLSDYERGAWGITGPESPNDFDKLCLETHTLPDTTLLRSSNHKSSGSTYDPSGDLSGSISRDWLIGAWVYADGCATSADLTFSSGGSLVSTGGDGRWEMRGNIITTIVTQTYDSEGEGPFPQYPPVTAELVVARYGIDSATFNGARALRC